MELCTGPDLATFLQKDGPLDEKRARMLIRQILSGMRYLTSQERVVHCDLKPRNILFHNGELKISDFGISQTSHDLVSEKRDVWSLGVIYFEMLYG